METTLVKISTLKHNTGQIEWLPKNPRFIKDEKYEKLLNSLRNYPDMLKLRELIAYDNSGEIVVICGNMRLRGLKELWVKEVPVKILPTETDVEELKAYTILDNVGFGEDDLDLLANEWNRDQLEAWGMDLPAMEIVEEELEEDEYEIPDDIQTDIVEGDFFEIGDHKLLCGDSTKVDTWEKVFWKELADMVMTDPPYNVNYEGGTGMKIENDDMDDQSFYQFLLDFYTALGAYTKKGGAWYVWHADSEGANFRTAMKNSGIMVKQCLIWVKNALVMGRQDYHWKHEPCLYGWKEWAAHYFTDDRTKTTVIEDEKPVDYKKMGKPELVKIIQGLTADTAKTTVIHCDKPAKNDVHPTMKPILLLGPLIQNSSRQGEIVGDWFLGSGSTMVACHQLHRKCYGMELDPKYCQVIVDRMRELDPNIIINRNGELWEL